MDIGFFAPSYKRPQKSITQKSYPFVKLVVKGDEAEEYRRNGNDIIVCPNEAQGNLCRVRNWILDNYQDKYDCIVLMDDDIHAVIEWEKQEKRRLKSDEVIEVFEMGAQLAKDAGVKFWGITAIDDKGAYMEHTPFSFSAYINGPVQCFMRGNELRYDEKLPLKEDYDMTLQQLKRYGYVLRLNFISLIVKQSEQAGGCATYRNIEKEKEQFLALRKKWGSKFIRFDMKSKGVFDYNPILKLPY